MIKIENLKFSYGRKPVLSGITLELRAGKIYGLLGENGVGKTTLLSLLCGLKKPQDGSICIDGTYGGNTRTCSNYQKTYRSVPYDRAPMYLEEMIYIPDEVVPFRMRAESWAKEYGSFRPFFTMNQFFEIMSLMEVDPMQKMSSMSGGQLKKTYISFALSCKPGFIYMDEPTNGLDIPSKAAFRTSILKYIPEESTVVIATHQVRDLENIIDPIIILDHNDVLLNESVEVITEKLFFDYGTVRYQNALYCEPTPDGMIQVLENNDRLDSKINIEALFNAVYKNKEKIKVMFNKGGKTTETL